MADTPPKFRKEILDAIEGLRIRKTRPNETSIQKFVHKKWGHSFPEIANDLERLVDDDAVQKVDYKGSISYRDTAKWIHAETSNAMMQLPVQFGCLLNSQFTTDRIMESVEGLSDSNEKMVPLSLEVIQGDLQLRHPGTKLRGDHLMKCLLREVDIGRLTQLISDDFVLAETVDRTARIKREGLKRPPQKPKPLNRLLAAKNPVNTRKKQINVLYEDESEPEPAPKKNKSKDSVMTSSPIPQKFPKFSDTFTNGKRQKRHCFECVDNVGMERARTGFLLECTGCPYAAHPDCAGYTKENVELITDSFTCMSCKRCKICGEGKLGSWKDRNCLTVCIRCDNCFHFTCHNPPLTLQDVAAKKEWKCSDCIAPRKSTKKQKDSAAMKAPYESVVREAASPVVDSDRSGIRERDGTSKGVVKPDERTREVVIQAIKCLEQSMPPQKTSRLVAEIRGWSVEDIAQRFDKEQKPLCAAAIRKQAIDGNGLILLAREDVITRFGLPFVEAVKMYRDLCLMCPFGPYSM